MSRTQDLVLARLRLIAMRWQGGALAHGQLPEPEQPESAQPASAQPASAQPELAQPASALAESPVLDATGPADERQESTWPAQPPWLRLIALLVGIVALGGAALLYTSWPREQPPPAVTSQASGRASDAFDDPFLAASPTPSPSMLVHVVGDVRHPGVVKLPAGSRVEDAVKEAGGLRRGGELGATNLARVLVDGERIEVGAVDGAGSAGPGATGQSNGPVDLNTASAEQLDTLPGIGPVTAAKILGWRTTNGRFTTVDELAEVPGIGPKTLAELRPLVRV